MSVDNRGFWQATGVWMQAGGGWMWVFRPSGEVDAYAKLEQLESQSTTDLRAPLPPRTASDRNIQLRRAPAPKTSPAPPPPPQTESPPLSPAQTNPPPPPPAPA